MNDTDKLKLNLDTSAGLRLIDFGPPLDYEFLCEAYTVERITLWERKTFQDLEVVPIRHAGYMPQARAQGNLYKLTEMQFLKLDSEREVGVQYDRKVIPVFLPLLDEDKKFQRVNAYTYIAIRDAWLPFIKKDTEVPHPLLGGEALNQTYSLVKTYPDSNPVLHNRQCFLPPTFPPIRVGNPPPSVLKNVRKRNRRFSRMVGWMQMKKRVKDFVNDE